MSRLYASKQLVPPLHHLFFFSLPIWTLYKEAWPGDTYLELHHVYKTASVENPISKRISPYLHDASSAIQWSYTLRSYSFDLLPYSPLHCVRCPWFQMSVGSTDLHVPVQASLNLVQDTTLPFFYSTCKQTALGE
jgi:hypothetical protein